MDFLSLPVIGLAWRRWQEEWRRHDEEVNRLMAEADRRRAPMGGQAQLESAIRCATCGNRLGDDPEDDPEGDAGLPICGECDRARNLDLREHNRHDCVGMRKVCLLAADEINARMESLS